MKARVRNPASNSDHIPQIGRVNSRPASPQAVANGLSTGLIADKKVVKLVLRFLLQPSPLLDLPSTVVAGTRTWVEMLR